MSDGVKKVAAFLSGLDCKTVDVLIRRFDDQTAAAIRKELLAMSDAAHDASNRAAIEFKRVRATGLGNGIDTFESSAATYAPPNRLQRQGPLLESPRQSLREETDGPFAFLKETPVRRTASMLLAERPQTIALVFAHLEPDTAAELLAQLPQPVQVEAMRSLYELEEIDRDVLLDVESALRERLLTMPAAVAPRRRIGTDAVKRIIAASDPELRRTLLEGMKPEPAAKCTKKSDTPTGGLFDALERMDDEELAMLFASIDRRIGMIALVGAPPRLIDRIVRRYTPAQQRKLRQQLTDLAPIRETDIHEARQIVRREAERLNAQPEYSNGYETAT